MRKRGELVERSFAHTLESGAMRRAHLRGQENIRKRYLIQTAAFNLGIVMRSIIGSGTPKGLWGRIVATLAASRDACRAMARALAVFCRFSARFSQRTSSPSTARSRTRNTHSSTGC